MNDWLPIIIVLTIPAILFFWHYRHKKQYGLVGAMGWLLFFNLGQLVYLGQLASLQGGFKNTDLELPFQVLSLFSAAITIYIIYLVIHKQNIPSTPSKIIQLLWVKGPIANLALYVLYIGYIQTALSVPVSSLSDNQLMTIFISPFLTDVVVTTLITYVWMLYFNNSIRVHNTYKNQQKFDQYYILKIVAAMLFAVLIIIITRNI